MKVAFVAIPLLALLMLAASADAHRDLLTSTLPACKDARPGQLCIGKVNGVTGKKCVKPLHISGRTCDKGVFGFLSQVVGIDTTQTGGTCKRYPCCDSANGPAECVRVAIATPCLIDLKLCVTGVVGSVLKTLIGNLDVNVSPVDQLLGGIL